MLQAVGRPQLLHLRLDGNGAPKRLGLPLGQAQGAAATGAASTRPLRGSEPSCPRSGALRLVARRIPYSHQAILRLLHLPSQGLHGLSLLLHLTAEVLEPAGRPRVLLRVDGWVARPRGLQVQRRAHHRVLLLRPQQRAPLGDAGLWRGIRGEQKVTGGTEVGRLTKGEESTWLEELSWSIHQLLLERAAALAKSDRGHGVAQPRGVQCDPGLVEHAVAVHNHAVQRYPELAAVPPAPDTF
mmetsp:Transcript_136756/g.381176  ORF Transcript_136756/g.381176 Transcript_136756/m.381176 type:complete len:241 (+) Transcript_136756:404-1126(+)